VKGNDENKGTSTLPLKSLEKAVFMAKNTSGHEALTIKIAPGLYMLSDKLTIESEAGGDINQYTIEALVMPKDSIWTPYAMPVIGSVSPNNDKKYFDHSIGILVARANVKIRGLKFIGDANPSVYYYYPVSKDTVSLPNLNISDCYFIGDRYGSVVQGAIYAEGPGIHVDHCIFYGCKNAVLVFENVRDFSLTHSIIYGAYECAVWYGGKEPDQPFLFSNNIISHCHFVWSAAKGLDHSGYVFNHSLISDNENYVGEQNGEGGVIPYATKPVFKENDIRHSGTVRLVEVKTDELPHNYLNLTPDSDGKDLSAGIDRR
jgi:hypothetical protein